MQVLYLPADTGLNALISGTLYSAAVLAAAQGILQRSGRRFAPGAMVVLLIGITGLLWYFFYIDRNLMARIYVQNFGYGAILLVTAIKLRALAGARLVDRVLFWMLLVFALHFFPRTVLTAQFRSRVDPAVFASSPFWLSLQLSLAVLGVGLAFAVLAAAVSDFVEALRHERDRDALTGLLNRRGFDEQAAGLLARRNGAAGVVVLDLDHFKSINDRFGHAAGDEVLRAVGAVLAEVASASRIVGRIGGEEFAVLLGTDSDDEVVELAESLRGRIELLRISALGGERITASLGTALGTVSDSFSGLMQRADAGLYKAKSAGRNVVVSEIVT